MAAHDAAPASPGPWAPPAAPPDGRPLAFVVRAVDGGSHARLGRLTLRHALVDTPVFMPVGTLGTIKALGADDAEALGARLILNNAYHLLLRPGPERIAAAGGLRAFTGHPGAILTDSGGYQIFSHIGRRQIDEEGVRFRSHVDGRQVALGPESLVALQEALFPDVAMVLDHCPSGAAGRDEVEQATARTSRWLRRCLAARRRSDLAWFGIVQGGTHLDLRAAHAEEVGGLPVDGVAIGGVSVGESRAEIARVVAATAPRLPADRPRYLMGVGTPHDLVRGVASGVDMFDCVMPSRHARNGQLFVAGGRLNIRHAHVRGSDAPIDPGCRCPTCRRHGRGFLRHLWATGELAYFRLATLHNVHFYLRLMAEMREDLAGGRFDAARTLKALGPEPAWPGAPPLG